MWRMAAIAATALLLTGCAEFSPAPAGLTERDRIDFALQEQDFQWFLAELPGQRPIVAPTFVTREKYAPLLNECYADGGLEELFFADDILVLPETPLTSDERLTVYLCSARYVIRPEELGYLSREELERVYDYYRDWLVPCIEAHGLFVPLAVSRSAFAATPGYVDWNPYYPLEQQLDPAVLSELQVACPYVPPGVY